MPISGTEGKRNLSTRLSYEEKETCRTFYFSRKMGQATFKIDKIRCQFMPNNLLALSDVALAICSKVRPLISAICSATNFT
jgi:hypothetical protein